MPVYPGARRMVGYSEVTHRYTSGTNLAHNSPACKSDRPRAFRTTLKVSPRLVSASARSSMTPLYPPAPGIASGECPRTFSPQFRPCLKADHLVQTHALGLQDIPINPVFSKRFSPPSGFRRATVVDFVAARSSRFNTVQQTVGNPALKTEDLPRGFQVGNLVPNQIQPAIEIC